MLPNVDPDNGIAYGAISQNCLKLDAMDNWYQNDRYYEQVKSEFVTGLKNLLEPYADEADVNDIIKQSVNLFNEGYQNDECGWYYKDDEFYAEYHPDLNDWLIMKSPYYTFCKGCSPCLPGAGHLEEPMADDIFGRKTYCLPNEFFEEGLAPYLYYSVD